MCQQNLKADSPIRAGVQRRHLKCKGAHCAGSERSVSWSLHSSASRIAWVTEAPGSNSLSRSFSLTPREEEARVQRWACLNTVDDPYLQLEAAPFHLDSNCQRGEVKSSPIMAITGCIGHNINDQQKGKILVPSAQTSNKWWVEVQGHRVTNLHKKRENKIRMWVFVILSVSPCLEPVPCQQPMTWISPFDYFSLHLGLDWCCGAFCCSWGTKKKQHNWQTQSAYFMRER